MPLYEYKCRSCGKESQQILPMEDRKLPEQSPCDECDGEIFQAIGNINLGYSYNTRKMSDNFNDRLKEIKRTKGMGNTINLK